MEKQNITVRAQVRQGRGKNDTGRLRREGLVPLTVYGGNAEAVAVTASLAELAAILRSGAGHNTIFTLDIEGVGASDVIFHDRQIDPVRGRLIHADLKRLVKGEKIEVSVPVHLVGEPYGVREESGLLEQLLREVEIRAEPRDIPDAIEADVSHLHAHDVLHVSDLKVEGNVEILADPETVVATVGVLRAEAEEVAPTEEEQAEPEVIGKGKKEEEEEG